MSSKPIFYNWYDVGSPGVAFSGNTQNRLKQILKPCLVDGYGDKPGAGWSTGHEHPNGFSLINVEGNVVNIVSQLPGMSTGNVCHLYLANSITDSSEAIIDGANLSSGPYRKMVNSVTGRHALPELTLNNSSKWTVLANGSSFVISTYSSNYCTILFVGNLINTTTPELPNFIALGGDNISYNDNTYPYVLSDGYTAPLNPVNGLNESVSLSNLAYRSKNSNKITSNPPVVQKIVQYTSPYISASASAIGNLPGIVFDQFCKSQGYLYNVRALGLDASSDNINKLVNIDGHNYVYCFGYDGGAVLTDNPIFWE